MPTNLYAPVALNGLQEENDPLFVYVFDVVLTSLQSLSDMVTINADADFLLRAIAVNSKTGIFKARFNRSGLYFLSNSYIHSNNLESDAASPLPILPNMIFVAGSRIGIDIVDLSAAGNTIQIAFMGAKLIR